jgi:hypothetical protein
MNERHTGSGYNSVRFDAMKATTVKTIDAEAGATIGPANPSAVTGSCSARHTIHTTQMDIVPTRWQTGRTVDRRRHRILMGAMIGVAALIAVSCQPADKTTVSTTTLAVSSTIASSTTTIAGNRPQPPSEPQATESFSVPVGDDGVTYDIDGEPASGPSSFTVLDDGSVVIADTMAANRGEPRLLHFDRTGVPISTIDLVDAGAASIVDVVTDGTDLAILSVRVELQEYRVLTLSTDGAVIQDIPIPDGYHLEDGLTGLAWGDAGVLLEFEFGTSYALVGDDGMMTANAPLVLDGIEIMVEPGRGLQTSVRVGETLWVVERATDLGGASLVGLAPDHSIVITVDEVDTTGAAFQVRRRIQRYSAAGELLFEYVLDPGDQYVEIMRPLELGADGTVLYLASLPNRVTIELEPPRN